MMVLCCALLCFVAQSYPTLCDAIDYSLPRCSVQGFLQARTLEWIAISFSRGSYRPQNQTRVSRIAGRHFTIWATRSCINSFIKYLYVCICSWMHTLIQFSSVTQLCLTLFDRINCFPVYHQLPELVQTHVHQVGDAIQPSPPAFSLYQHQFLFQWVSSSHQVVTVLDL